MSKTKINTKYDCLELLKNVDKLIKENKHYEADNLLKHLSKKETDYLYSIVREELQNIRMFEESEFKNVILSIIVNSITKGLI